MNPQPKYAALIKVQLIALLLYLIVMTRPEFLYKYRQDERYSLDALFTCKAIFGGRQTFNDPYDARVELIEPTIEELEHIDFTNRVSLNPETRGTPRFIENKALTKKGNTFLRNLYQTTENIVDAYRFLCLSAIPTSASMWHHYAKEHTGFCIEFKSEFVGGDEVVYRNDFLGIQMANFVVAQRQQKIGIDIWKALRTKRTDWEYEREYRIQPSNEMSAWMVPINAKISSAKYKPEYVESIIFGKDMPLERRRFIIQNCKFPVKFKQVVMGRSALAIIDFL